MYGLTPFERNFFDSVNDFDKAFAKSGVRACRTDIREDDDKFIMESELPGFEKEDITIISLHIGTICFIQMVPIEWDSGAEAVGMPHLFLTNTVKSWRRNIPAD